MSSIHTPGLLLLSLSVHPWSRNSHASPTDCSSTHNCDQAGSFTYSPWGVVRCSLCSTLVFGFPRLWFPATAVCVISFCNSSCHCWTLPQLINHKSENTQLLSKVQISDGASRLPRLVGRLTQNQWRETNSAIVHTTSNRRVCIYVCSVSWDLDWVREHKRTTRHFIRTEHNTSRLPGTVHQQYVMCRSRLWSK